LPKRMTPSIYTISKRRSQTVPNALLNDAWVCDIDILGIRSATQLREFTALWERLRGCNLTLKCPTPSFGFTQIMANTLQLPPTRLNSMGFPPRPWKT
jgi:CelD/BcsL family acetyltransferase involved in cellulose biosynthesis